MTLNKAAIAAYSYALRLLARREYCESEMYQRLQQKGYDEAIQAEVIAELQASNYLSEYRFAESFLRSRLKRGEAPWLAAQKARQKGVQCELLDCALAEITEAYNAEEVCRELLLGRDPSGLRFEDQRVWQRQARFLRNKGFDTATILRVLQEKVGDSR